MTLPTLLASMLRVIGSLSLLDADLVAAGVGLDSTTMLSYGKASDLPRTGSVSLGNGSDQPVRVNPDEAGSPPRNYEWVFEADIAACFDEISNTALMGRVRRLLTEFTGGS